MWSTYTDILMPAYRKRNKKSWASACSCPYKQSWQLASLSQKPSKVSCCSAVGFTVSHSHSSLTNNRCRAFEVAFGWCKSEVSLTSGKTPEVIPRVTRVPANRWNGFEVCFSSLFFIFLAAYQAAYLIIYSHREVEVADTAFQSLLVLPVAVWPARGTGRKNKLTSLSAKGSPATISQKPILWYWRVSKCQSFRENPVTFEEKDFSGSSLISHAWGDRRHLSLQIKTGFKAIH